MTKTYIYKGQKDLNKTASNLYKKIKSDKFLKDLYDLDLGFFRLDRPDSDEFEYILGGACSTVGKCVLTEDDLWHINLWFPIEDFSEYDNMEWLLKRSLWHYWSNVNHYVHYYYEDDPVANEKYNKRWVATQQKLTLIIKRLFEYFGIEESIRTYSKREGCLKWRLKLRLNDKNSRGF